MEVTGSLPSQAEQQPLWDALMDSNNWKEAIPGVSKYELVGENLYEMTVNVDIGPIKGDKSIKIQFSDIQPPTSSSFDILNDVIKTAKGSFDLSEPTGEVPEGTKTLINYKLEVDAGNPFFNAMIEMYKGQMQSGFEELLTSISNKAVK